MRRFRPQNTQQNMTSVEGRELNSILQLTFKLVVTQVQGIQRGKLDDRFGEGA